MFSTTKPKEKMALRVSCEELRVIECLPAELLSPLEGLGCAASRAKELQESWPQKSASSFPKAIKNHPGINDYQRPRRQCGGFGKETSGVVLRWGWDAAGKGSLCSGRNYNQTLLSHNVKERRCFPEGKLEALPRDPPKPGWRKHAVSCPDHRDSPDPLPPWRSACNAPLKTRSRQQLCQLQLPCLLWVA